MGLLVSPARRRSFTTAAKIADTFLLGRSVMSDIVAHQDADDTDKPPPCPWCDKSGVKEITGSGGSDTRWFTCQSCKRVFSIRCELLKPPEKRLAAHRAVLNFSV